MEQAIASSPPLPRLKRREPAWKEVYRHLRMAILNGQFAPNARLLELELANALGVSRTPVREALARLETDGLVTATERSFIVSDLREDLVDAYHLRAALESYAVRLAAERATPQEIEQLRDNVARSYKVDLSDTVQRAQINEEFHRMLAAASRSPRIRRAFETQRDLVMTDEDMRLHTPEALQRFLREHDMIVSAIEMRDPDTAERLMRAHLRHAVTLLVEGAQGHAVAIAREEQQS
jgi:DNA-binding GntR family transcriptional regulator